MAVLYWDNSLVKSAEVDVWWLPTAEPNTALGIPTAAKVKPLDPTVMKEKSHLICSELTTFFFFLNSGIHLAH